jgi:hypothetical protein
LLGATLPERRVPVAWEDRPLHGLRSDACPSPPTPRPLLLQVKCRGRRFRLLALQAQVEQRSAVVIQTAFRSTHVGRSHAVNAATEAEARGAPLVEVSYSPWVEAVTPAVLAAQTWVAEAEAQLEAAEKEEAVADEVQEGAATEVEAVSVAGGGAGAVAGADVGAAAGVQRGAASPPQRHRSLQSSPSGQTLTPEWVHDLRVEIHVTREQLEAGEGAGAGAAEGGAAAGAGAITPSDSGTLSDVGTLSDPGTPPEAVTPPEGYSRSGRRHRPRTTSSTSTRYSSRAPPTRPNPNPNPSSTPNPNPNQAQLPRQHPPAVHPPGRSGSEGGRGCGRGGCGGSRGRHPRGGRCSQGGGRGGGGRGDRGDRGDGRGQGWPARGAVGRVELAVGLRFRLGLGLGQDRGNPESSRNLTLTGAAGGGCAECGGWIGLAAEPKLRQVPPLLR